MKSSAYLAVMLMAVCLAGPCMAHKGLSLPLNSMELADPNIEDLSFFGAHSYIRAKVDYLGIPALYWQQFSDGDRTSAIMNPVLRISLPGSTLGGPPTTSYEWRPDRASLCMLSKDFTARQEIGYADENTIVAVVALIPRTNSPLEIKLEGAVSDKLKGASVTPLPRLGGLSIKVKSLLTNPWGMPTTNFEKDWVIATNIRGLTFNISNRSYSAILKHVPREGLTAIIVLTRGSRSEADIRKLLDDPHSALDATTHQVDDWLAEVKKPKHTDGPRARVYYNAWYQLWYNTESAEGYWTHPIITPSKYDYGRGVWLWDTGFHVLALAQGGAKALRLAKDQVLVLCDAAKVDGHLPREVWVGAVGPNLQAPGILTWAAMEIYKRDKDRAFLRQVYDTLASNNDWFYKVPSATGLREWTGADSGWDTSPRWDCGMVYAVDLNCWLYLDQLKLAEMAKAIGRPDDARKWTERSEKTKALIRRHLWDERDGCYYDLDPRTLKFVRVKTPATFWTMFAGVATAEQAGRMVKMITDPAALWTKYPLPCVGCTESTYQPDNYWRGPTWINLNWITILGLENYGYKNLARQLRDKSLGLIEMSPVPYEYYNSQTGAGLGAKNYTWTGALYTLLCNHR